MGQDWMLMNLDKREHCSLPKLGEALFSSEPWHFEQDFLPTPSVYVGEAPPPKDITINIRASLDSSIFSRLPLELYDIVLESMVDYFDCICLGLTCRFLWNVARRHVHKRYVEEVPVSWSGGRIICAGSFSERDDPLPAGMFTEAEEKEYNTPLPTKGCECGGWHKPNELSSNLGHFACCRFTGRPSRRDVIRELGWRAKGDSFERHLHPDDFQILKSVLCVPKKPIVQEVELARPLVLRNLSRKLYVREEAIDQFMEDNLELISPYYDILLGHVLLMRVCWSSCDSVSMVNPIALHRGPWAGDRFDYVSAKDFRTEEGGDRGQRQKFSKIISSVRAVLPKVPFWTLRAHRLPTLWTLYRGLLRHAGNDDVRWRIGKVFRRYRHDTSPGTVRSRLAQYHNWLERFELASAGDMHMKAILARYGQMIAARRDKERFKAMLRDEIVRLSSLPHNYLSQGRVQKWQDRLANRPIVTGAYFRPSHSNPPLPRLVPQPVPLSMIIRNRRRARAQRGERRNELQGALEDLRTEAQFEEELLRQSQNSDSGKFEPEFSGPNLGNWQAPIKEKMKDIAEAFERDTRRANMPFPELMLKQIKEARKERHLNHQRELQRELKGEVLKATLRRRKLGFPAHVTEKWGKEKLKKMLSLRRRLKPVGLSREEQQPSDAPTRSQRTHDVDSSR
ncbi:hypothetical protein EWM64_g4203 [Hericium alpestre]|uniref:F-box domain-containing protein n=1 Tax=Hericium alpestre TaxID=135208 RepID=A0A4Z0A1T7_9AGAM|nr:hypothetical protein EWM64_g4203 [Hericium alpestre]